MQVRVTDEMIARYLSGKSTPEEASAVLDYMSENDENLESLLAMSAAIEQFGVQKAEQKKRVRSLWLTVSAAASVILFIGLGIALWHNSQSGNAVSIDPAPAYGEQVSVDSEPAYAGQDSIAELEEDKP